MKWNMWMMNKSTWTGIVTALAIGSLAPACDSGSGAPSAVAITRGQLADRLAAGPLRIEVELAADGSVREVHIEDEGPGHEAQLAGRVMAFDAIARTLDVEFLGTVDFAAAGRFRTEAESNADAATWIASVEAALASGDVWLDVRGAFVAGRFAASEVRWEAQPKRKLEADIDASVYDDAAGTLTIGALTFEVGSAAFFDGSDDSDDLLDDHGDDGIEAGDDHGDDGLEAGDDHGDDGIETGDDHGDDGVETGDDHGDDGVETGDDHGDDGVETGDDHGQGGHGQDG